MNNINVYCFSGKLGSGKNYIAENVFKPLLHNNGDSTLVMALADHFKVESCIKKNISYERIFIKKDTESRKILQLMGTEEGRMVYGENIWVNMLLTWIRVYAERGIKSFIITDIRFPNEAELFKKYVGAKIIRINAPTRVSDQVATEANGDINAIKIITSHASETSLDNYTNFDHIINNDYENESTVLDQVKKIL